MISRPKSPELCRFAVAALCLALAACGEPEPIDPVAALASMPSGDAPWRAALDSAENGEQLEAVLTTIRGLADSHPDRWEPSWALGEGNLRLEAITASRAPFERAIEIARRVNDPSGIAASANGLAWVVYRDGNATVGEALFREGLEASIRAGRQDLEAFLRNNLANLLLNTAHLPGARDELEQAESLLRAIGRGRAAQGVAHNRAIVTLMLGDATTAESLLHTLHEKAVADDDAWGVEAGSVVLGNLHVALDELDEADRWFSGVGDRFKSVYLTAMLGRIRVALGRDDAAAALEHLRQIPGELIEGDPRAALTHGFWHGEVLYRAGDAEAAERVLRDTIEEAERSESAEVPWIGRWRLGRMLRDEGKLDEAADLLRNAVEAIDRQRDRLDPMGDGMRYLRERFDPYADLAVTETLVGGPDAAESVLDLASRSRARALRRAMAADGWARTDASIESLESRLRDDEALVVYLLGADRGVALIVRRGAARLVVIDGHRRISPSLRAYRAHLERAGRDGFPPEAETLGAELHDALIAPLGSHLEGARRLYVVPDREMALVPFDALRVDGRWLGERLETALIPLATTPEPAARSMAPVLLAGVPEAVPDGLAELEWSAYELSYLQEIWGDDVGASLTGDRWTRDELLGQPLASFGLIHLATHAEASTRDPRRCSVLLSNGERLGFSEISELELDGSLVVLSACRTGEGELLPGEGVVGLGWAFLRAGAAGVLVSQWTVDDASTAQLMRSFHAELRKGRDPVAALAAARRATMEAHPDPSRWAPFVLLLRPRLSAG